MNISPVSFRSTAQANPLADLIAKPQTYTTNPPAASGINTGDTKKSSTGKKVLGAVVVAAAIATGLALGKTKLGNIAENYQGKEFIKKGLQGLANAGENISKVASAVREKIPFLAKKVAE